MNKKPIQLAILDLYDGTPNQGMRAIEKILQWYEDHLSWKIFDVRGKAEVPGLEYDIFISTGGPGDPLEGDGHWDQQYFDLIDRLWRYNQTTDGPKKYAFFICHSFQMISDHFRVAKVMARRQGSFGTFPCHKTEAGRSEPLFKELSDPFYIADFRDYQVVLPDWNRINELGAQVLAVEAKRSNIKLERAVMAIRFSDTFVGTQFHPEADPEGMLVHFQKSKKKQEIIKKYGQEIFDQIIADLNDPARIQMTHQTVIPGFLEDAIKSLQAHFHQV